MAAGRFLMRGFTIIELLLVIVILAILASLTAPSMQEFVRAAAIRSASSDFYGALAAARSEAIKRRASMSVVAKGASWAAGWDVRPAAGGNIVQTTDALASDVGVTSGVTTITFANNGRVSAGSGTVVFYSLSMTSIQARCVVVDVNGLPRTRTDSNKVYSDGCN